MRTFNIDITVEDNWEPCYCDNCPLGYEQDYYDEDDGYDYWHNCVLGGSLDVGCPLVGREVK